MRRQEKSDGGTEGRTQNMKEIFHRTSIRKYETKPVKDEKIEKLLRAAMAAPSAGIRTNRCERSHWKSSAWSRRPGTWCCMARHRTADRANGRRARRSAAPGRTGRLRHRPMRLPGAGTCAAGPLRRGTGALYPIDSETKRSTGSEGKGPFWAFFFLFPEIWEINSQNSLHSVYISQIHSVILHLNDRILHETKRWADGSSTENQADPDDWKNRKVSQFQ